MVAINESVITLDSHSIDLKLIKNIIYIKSVKIH